ncbi:MAG: AraC family transcriptional regulator [Lachnospiraceae bacterium]|nr:AraC family transcriptional regulator [Lachnospiraceae bacterium]MDE6979896.1 AraC family transcriptional regulator [Lachnospiraceae bacterium]
MIELNSCKTAMEAAARERYFAVAHLYKDEKAMDMHIHDCYEVYYSISGGKQFLIDNKLYSIEPGNIFVINQYESHYLTQIDQAVHERIILSIHPDFIKNMSTEQTDLEYCFTKRPAGFSHKLQLTKEQQKRFLFYINKITSSNDYGSDLIERCVFCELFIMINSICRFREEKPWEESSVTYNAQVDEILSYINNNIHETISIADLASRFFISESYICRIFKATTGTTINKYITARRISIAKSLLAEGIGVTEVCEQCGFNDYSNFLKSFSKSVGISPKKYAQICHQ